MDIKISRSKRYLPLEDFGEMLELADISLDSVLERVQVKGQQNLDDLSMIDKELSELTAQTLRLSEAFKLAEQHQKKINGLLRVFKTEDTSKE